jgi:hypothetical protein
MGNVLADMSPLTSLLVMLGILTLASFLPLLLYRMFSPRRKTHRGATLVAGTDRDIHDIAQATAMAASVVTDATSTVVH